MKTKNKKNKNKIISCETWEECTENKDYWGIMGYALINCEVVRKGKEKLYILFFEKRN